MCGTSALHPKAPTRRTMRSSKFGACAACHSLQPNRNMTGRAYLSFGTARLAPSQVSSVSSALASSEIIWDDTTLDAWISDPQHFIPGNTMTFPGAKDGANVPISWPSSRRRPSRAARRQRRGNGTTRWAA